VGAHTVVVMVGDGAEWIWNRAGMFVRPCEIFDFWHALEHAWEFAQLRYGEGSAQTDPWVHLIAEDLWAGKVQEVIARLKRVRPKTPELRESLQALIRYYSETPGACVMICDWAMGSVGDLRQLIQSGNARLVGSDGRQLAYPNRFTTCFSCLNNLQPGKATSIVPGHRQLTTQSAAAILGVSRVFLAGLLEKWRNAIP
jgi:hypothetical protein